MAIRKASPGQKLAKMDDEDTKGIIEESGVVVSENESLSDSTGEEIVEEVPLVEDTEEETEVEEDLTEEVDPAENFTMFATAPLLEGCVDVNAQDELNCLNLGKEGDILGTSGRDGDEEDHGGVEHLTKAKDLGEGSSSVRIYARETKTDAKPFKEPPVSYVSTYI